MKAEEAQAIIQKKAGFRVSFEERKNGMFFGDYFPAREESPISTEEEAWKLAGEFARASGEKKIVNVYVIHGNDWTPVDNYEEKKLNIYLPW